MRRPRRLAVRLTALYAGLFVASIAVLSGVIWLAAERAIKSQIAEGVKREAISLADEFRATDAATAALLVERRLRRGRSSFYLLQAPSGVAIAGNIEPVVPLVGPFEGRIELAPADPASARPLPELRQVIGYGALLADGTLVVAADGVERLDAAERAILIAFAAAGATALALAIAGGLLLSRGFLRRIEAINATAGEIIAGRFEARIPVRADGDEIDALALKLNAMLERIHGLMENLKQVSSDIAHDLRTPLARLRQTLDSARGADVPDEERRAGIDRALAETDDLLGAFSALLRISQVESKARRAAFAPLDLSALMAFAAQTFAPIAEDEGKRLDVDLAPDLWIEGDRELLLQLFANLIENAIRHTPEGARAALSLRAEGGRYLARLADDGPGVPTAEHEKVLRRFYRLERSRTSAGNGLGLALVAAVADLHSAPLTLADAEPGLAVEIAFAPAAKLA